jgi:PAS domain S-box-containing protein
MGGIWSLYQTTISEQKTRLVEIVQSRARLIEAIARFDSINIPNHPGGSLSATVSQIKDAHAQFTGFGKTGEFTLASRVGDQIVFILRHRHHNLEKPAPIPFEAQLAEPMRKALLGQSGLIVGQDYRGELVMAAYEPVAILNFGVVAKIDLSEVRAPFLRTASYWFVFSFVLVFFGVWLFFKVGYPIVRRIQENEENLETTLNSIGDAVISTDDVGNIVRMNPVAEQLTGWQLSEVQGHPLQEVFQIVNSRSGEPVPNPVEKVLKIGKIVGLANPTALIDKNGQHHQIADSGSPIRDMDNKIIGVVLVFRDVTDEYQQQEDLRASFELSQNYLDVAGIMLASLDRTGNITMINQKGCDLFGYEHDDLIGKDWFTICLPKRMRREVKTVFNTLMAGEIEPVEYYENLVLNKVGDERLVAFHNTVIKDKYGQILGVLFSGEDITESKRTEALLLDSKKTAEAANIAKSEFLAVMSHELRTPLNAILGMAEIVKDTDLDSNQAHYMEVLNRAGEGMLSLIEDILDVTKIESGKVILEKKSIALRELVQYTIEMHEKNASNKGLGLICQTAPEIPDFFTSDPKRIRQIILNLVGNAVKFTNQGTVKLYISSPDKDTLTFSISDTGIGISEEKLDIIFKPFSQLDSSSTRQHGGVGIGLSLCKGLVNALGGQIWVESAIGKGSTFHFSIPFSPVERKRLANHVDFLF